MKAWSFAFGVFAVANGFVRGMCWVGTSLSDQFRLAVASLHRQATVLWEFGPRQSDARPAVTLRERAASAAVTAVLRSVAQSFVKASEPLGDGSVYCIGLL